MSPVVGGFCSLSRSSGASIYILWIRMGLSASVADRPYVEFSSSSERATKRVVWGAGIEPARFAHVVYEKKMATGTYSGILISSDAVVNL